MTKLTLSSPAVTVVAAVLGFQFKPYYQFTFTASQLVSKTRMDDNGSTMDRSQRTCDEKRAKKFAEYLIKNIKDDHAWVIPPIMANIDTDGDEDAVCFESMADILNTPDDITARSVGKLGISGDAWSKLFDGQHRTRGIAIALHDLNADKKNRDAYLALRAKTVSIMAFVGLTLEERQVMFSDINLNMNKPQAAIGISYDHRCALSRFVSELAGELPFKGLVELEKNTIGKKSDKLFSVKTIFDFCKVTMGLSNKFTNDDITTERKQFVRDVLAKFSRPMGWSALEFVENAAQVRDEKVTTHIVMLKAIAEAAKAINAQYPEFEGVDLNKLSDLNYGRTKGDFVGRCIDPISMNMRASQTGVRLAANLLVTTAGATLDPEAAALEKQYFGAHSDANTQAEIEAFKEQPAPVEQEEEKQPIPAIIKDDVRTLVTIAAGGVEKKPATITKAVNTFMAVANEYEDNSGYRLQPIFEVIKDKVKAANTNEGDEASWKMISRKQNITLLLLNAVEDVY